MLQNNALNRLVREVLNTYWQKSQEVIALQETNDKFDQTQFNHQTTINMERIGYLLRNTLSHNRQEEEILKEILLMLKEGFENRTSPQEIMSWLNFIPWTLEGYLENHGLLQSVKETNVAVRGSWVSNTVQEELLDFDLELKVA